MEMWIKNFVTLSLCYFKVYGHIFVGCTVVMEAGIMSLVEVNVRATHCLPKADQITLTLNKLTSRGLDMRRDSLSHIRYN